MPDAVHELLATEVALAKLGARDISAEEVVYAALWARLRQHFSEEQLVELGGSSG
jgi:hypothetical protein